MKGENIIINKRKRIHLEVLRIIAIWFVIFNHTEARGFLRYTVAQNSKFYWVYMFISILCKIAVPLFFMISGALLIPKEEDIKTVYKKRVFRFFIILVLFSFINYVYQVRWNWNNFSINYFFTMLYSWKLETAYWYLYSYLGTLVMLPLIRKLVLNMKKEEFIYLAICQIIIVGFIPIIEYLLSKGATVYNTSFAVDMVTSNNIFYFIMGHYFENILQKEERNKKYLYNMIIVSICFICISCYMTHYKSIITGEYYQTFHNGLIAVPTFTAYIGIKTIMEKCNISNMSEKAIVWAGSCTFGIMLFEGILRGRCEFIFKILTPYINTYIVCMIFVTAVMISGLVLTTILKRMYITRKLI